MKMIYYKLTYLNGLCEYFSKQVPESYNFNQLKEQLYESQGGIRNITIYNTQSEYNTAKNFSLV